MVIVKKNIVGLILGVCIYGSSHAGITDTIHAIEAIEIQSSRLEQFHLGASVHEIDSEIVSLYPAESIAALLNENSLVSINNYGPGGLTSISIRGGGSKHSTIVWNGMNINSPMNGGVNFATIPVMFVDKAHIQHGGSSTLFGSGAATGSFHLHDELKLNSGFSTEFSGNYGSAHNKILAGSIRYGNNKWASAIKYFQQENENDFRFRNVEKFEEPYENLAHGAYSQRGISNSNRLMINEKSWISSNVLLLTHAKDIPSPMSDYSTNQSAQEDNNVLYTLKYSRILNNLRINFNTGGIYNQVLYFHPDPMLSNDNNSLSFQSSAEFKFNTSKGFNFGAIAEHKNARARSGSYLGLYKRNTFTGILSLKYSSAYFSTMLNVREELVNEDLIPIIFSWGVDIPLYEVLEFRTQLSKNYTLPTFNDLYWKPGEGVAGNPDLLPENAWTSEAGLYWNESYQRVMVEASGSVFHSLIENWIIWLPDGLKIYTPQNIQKGVSTGAEITTLTAVNYAHSEFKLRTTYGYTRAIAKESSDEVVQEGVQLVYVPQHTARFQFSARYKSISSGYSYSLNGSRTFDKAGGTLPFYSIMNAFVKVNLELTNSFDTELFLKINNLANTEYQVRKSYAMPLRQFLVGVKIKFQK